MPEKKYDFSCENFDEYLLSVLDRATPDQIDLIPTDLYNRIHRAGKWVISEKMTYAEKAYIIHAITKQKIFIVVEPTDGLVPESPKEQKKIAKGKISLADLAKGMHEHGGFVLGNRELVDTLSYFRWASVTKVYRLTQEMKKKGTGVRNKKRAFWNLAMRDILGRLVSFEASKRKALTKHKIELREYYALIYFYIKEGEAADFLDAFKSAMFVNNMTMRRAVYSLVARGLITRRGRKPRYTYSISASGQEIVDKIVEEFFLDA